MKFPTWSSSVVKASLMLFLSTVIILGVVVVTTVVFPSSPSSWSHLATTTRIGTSTNDKSRLRSQGRGRELTLNPLTPEMQVLASVSSPDVLHTLFLSLDYDENDNTITRYARQQKEENPNGNLVVMAEGMGPLFPLVRPGGSFLDWSTLLLSRLSRPIWNGKYLEFPNPDSGTKGDVKFINQYVGIEGWTGHVYPGHIQQVANIAPTTNAVTGEKTYELRTIVPGDTTVVTLDNKPSIILDYSMGENWGTNVVDECRPLNRDKLLAANVYMWGDTITAEEWEYVWLCRGTSPRFFQFGGERVFFVFFVLQIIPDTMKYNITRWGTSI